jgi:predicted KAP-like P-loop ATPase
MIEVIPLATSSERRTQLVIEHQCEAIANLDELRQHTTSNVLSKRLERIRHNIVAANRLIDGIDTLAA